MHVSVCIFFPREISPHPCAGLCPSVHAPGQDREQLRQRVHRHHGARGRRQATRPILGTCGHRSLLTVTCRYLLLLARPLIVLDGSAGNSTHPWYISYPWHFGVCTHAAYIHAHICTYAHAHIHARTHRHVCVCVYVCVWVLIDHVHTGYPRGSRTSGTPQPRHHRPLGSTAATKPLRRRRRRRKRRTRKGKRTRRRTRRALFARGGGRSAAAAICPSLHLHDTVANTLLLLGRR